MHRCCSSHGISGQPQEKQHHRVLQDASAQDAAGSQHPSSHLPFACDILPSFLKKKNNNFFSFNLCLSPALKACVFLAYFNCQALDWQLLFLRQQCRAGARLCQICTSTCSHTPRGSSRLGKQGRWMARAGRFADTARLGGTLPRRAAPDRSPRHGAVAAVTVFIFSQFI